MEQSKTVQKACELLIRRVRFENASIRLPGHSLESAVVDTQAVKDATKVYIETWVVPLLEAIRKGDTKTLQRITR